MMFEKDEWEEIKANWWQYAIALGVVLLLVLLTHFYPVQPNNVSKFIAGVPNCTVNQSNRPCWSGSNIVVYNKP